MPSNGHGVNWGYDVVFRNETVIRCVIPIGNVKIAGYSGGRTGIFGSVGGDCPGNSMFPGQITGRPAERPVEA
jgi:hypothetical protein